eukprot:TRINITY_DN480_c0_g1_i11.p1 TRINITY_DN480_c0_g1~~TRINITY_DN480_c0_g1_i11.p1  ORF type:complete len:172 (-),score=71.03 TRINITY_DN480_c0_g1_i11:465-980(-)
MSSPNKALIVIDIQNDYFPGGKYALWNTEITLENNLKAIENAHKNKIPVILVRHIVNSDGPFFVKDSHGAEIHSQILAAAPEAPIIIKEFADSFHQTNLEETLCKLGVNELLICGMMTHNCITHTSISKSAEKYKINILTDCCTTITEIVHLLALHALGVRVTLTSSTSTF